MVEICWNPHPCCSAVLHWATWDGHCPALHPASVADPNASVPATSWEPVLVLGVEQHGTTTHRNILKEIPVDISNVEFDEVYLTITTILYHDT